MPKHILTVLDTAGIQSYIFRSNVLRENIGASQLVWQATKQWPLEIIREQEWHSNVMRVPTQSGEELYENWCIEDHPDDDAVEVVYAAGGNCVLLSTSQELSKELVTKLSLKLIERAPGLSLIAAHTVVDLGSDVLGQKIREVLGDLARKKRQGPQSTPLMGMSTTVECQSTARPAVTTDAAENLSPDGGERPISAEILAKLQSVQDANARLRSKLPQFSDAGLHIPNQLDHFHPDDAVVNYIAVVHADGNGMGRRVEAILKDYDTPSQNRDYIAAMRDFSKAVEVASTMALQAIADRLLRHWVPKANTIVGQTRHPQYGEWTQVGTPIHLNTSGDRPRIPFRPIVFGGDDLTFVTDGCLGLTLAAAYLEAFQYAVKQQSSFYVHDLEASAGVAIVKSHYPFSLAYSLAEQLAKNAKSASERKTAALDWHFAQSGLLGKLEDIRRRNYVLSKPVSAMKSHRLDMRPIVLTRDDTFDLDQWDPWRSWQALERLLTEFAISDAWSGKRNKVIALREALRKGPRAVEAFLRTYQLGALPELDETQPMLSRQGWSGSRCGYFDAIEAMDFYVPLNWGEET